MIRGQDASSTETTIQKTDINPETEDINRKEITIRRESMADINNATIHREVARADINKDVAIIITIRVVINNEEIMIREEVTDKKDTNKEDTIKAEGIAKAEDTTAEGITKVEDIAKVEVTTAGDTSKEGINKEGINKEGINREDLEVVAPTCAGHNKAAVVIIQGKVSPDL